MSVSKPHPGTMTSPVKEDDGRVVVKTTLPTLPLPPDSSRPTVTTARLTIRPIQESDLPAMHALRLQPEVMIWTGQGVPDVTPDETRRKYARYLAPGNGETLQWVVEERESGAVVGVGGVHKFAGDFGWPEIGYMLRKEAWGKGYATEAARGLLDAYAASVAERKEGGKAFYVEGTWGRKNPASGRILTKLGMKEVGWKEEEEPVFLGGEWQEPGYWVYGMYV